MIKGYKDFYYNLTDMNRAIQFFTEVFEMAKTYGHEHWTTMTLGNLNVGLHWTEGEAIPPKPRNSHGQNNGGTLTLHSDDIIADRKKIEHAGGKIFGESRQDWGHMLVFEDLDGNVHKLMN